MFQPNYFNLEYVFYQIYLFLQKIGLIATIDGEVVFTGEKYIYFFKALSIFISVFLTFMIVDFFHRLLVVRREEQAKMLETVLKNLPSEEKKNIRWEEVQRLIISENESDLKLAVIEADKMLDELLTVLGYQGMTIGDKLLAVEKGDMQSLDDAWEAHKFRNKIAHETGFQVTQREARRIISLYAKVFQEYRYI